MNVGESGDFENFSDHTTYGYIYLCNLNNPNKRFCPKMLFRKCGYNLYKFVRLPKNFLNPVRKKLKKMTYFTEDLV